MPDNEPTSAGALTEQQREFCRQYLIDMNASGAARRAGYSEATARGHAYELLQNVAVEAEIRKLIAERAARTMVSADRVLLELAVIAFSNVSDYTFDADGTVQLDEGVDPLAIRAVNSIRRKSRKSGRGDDAGEEVEVEIRLWDKLAALKLLGQHLGLFEKRTVIQGDPERPLRVTGEVECTHRAGLPADDAILECLRRLGLPLPSELPAVGGG